MAKKKTKETHMLEDIRPGTYEKKSLMAGLTHILFLRKPVVCLGG